MLFRVRDVVRTDLRRATGAADVGISSHLPYLLISIKRHEDCGGGEPLDCRVFGVCEVAVSIPPIATLPSPSLQTCSECSCMPPSSSVAVRPCFPRAFAASTTATARGACGSARRGRAPGTGQPTHPPTLRDWHRRAPCLWLWRPSAIAARCAHTSVASDTRLVATISRLAPPPTPGSTRTRAPALRRWQRCPPRHSISCA